MGIVRVALIVFSIATIFSLGLTSIPANAQFTNFTSNFVHVEWDTIAEGAGVSPSAFTFDGTNGLPLYTTGGFQNTMDCDANLLCTFNIQNFVDELDTKIIEIDISFFGTPPGTPVVTCFNNGQPSPGTQFFYVSEPDVSLFDFVCHPNPDWEEIVIQLNNGVILVEFWTETFDEIAVGGTMVPIDTTALLLAGVQSISMWMIPVVAAGVVIGVFVIKRRK